MGANMIRLSRLNGNTIAVNPDLITWVEVTPDTTVSLLGGDRIIVREPLDEVIAKVIEFRRSVGAGATAYPPSADVLQGIAARREAKASETPAARTSYPPIAHRR